MQRWGERLVGREERTATACTTPRKRPQPRRNEQERANRAPRPHERRCATPHRRNACRISRRTRYSAAAAASSRDTAAAAAPRAKRRSPSLAAASFAIRERNTRRMSSATASAHRTKPRCTRRESCRLHAAWSADATRSAAAAADHACSATVSRRRRARSCSHGARALPAV